MHRPLKGAGLQIGKTVTLGVGLWVSTFPMKVFYLLVGRSRDTQTDQYKEVWFLMKGLVK